MALTRVQINKKSDEKRGVRTKGFKLHVDDIAMIKQTALDLNMPEAKLVVEAVKFFKASNT